MRLRDLNPQVEQVKVATTRHPVMMVPTGDWRLSFYCPTCGSPFSLSILIGKEQQESPRRWKCDPMPELGEEENWFNKVTITPSINNTVSHHGPRKPSCSFHGFITNGEVK